MNTLNTYKAPFYKWPLFFFLAFFFVSIFILVLIERKSGYESSPIAFGLIGGMAPFLLQSRGRYRLLDEGIEGKHFLQKKKLIDYTRIYKIVRTKAYLPKKWLGGPQLPFTLEVFYDKFDSIPIVVKDIEDFEASLKSKLEARGLADKVEFKSSVS